MSASRRSAVMTTVALGGLASIAWPRRCALVSLTARGLSRRHPNAAIRRGVRIDLGPAKGRWSSPPLATDLGPSLSDVIGEEVAAAAYSRFGGFSGGRAYSAYLDPTSPYYQAWLSAYIVFDRPNRLPFGFDSTGAIRPEDVEAVLEADQRLVFHSMGVPSRFPDGRCLRLVGVPEGERPSPYPIGESDSWWKMKGEAETFSTFCLGGSPIAVQWGRRLYGVAPRKAGRRLTVRDFHPISQVGEFWLRHDPSLGATCGVLLTVSRYIDAAGNEVMAGRHLLQAAPSLLQRVSFTVDLP